MQSPGPVAALSDQELCRWSRNRPFGHPDVQTTILSLVIDPLSM